MRKISHYALAKYLNNNIFKNQTPLERIAFAFGSIEPDFNFFAFFRGSIQNGFIKGHDFDSAKCFINRSIKELDHNSPSGIHYYYHLGHCAHYIADSFTAPHNTNFDGGMTSHFLYEGTLHATLSKLIIDAPLQQDGINSRDVYEYFIKLHEEYMEHGSDTVKDANHILRANVTILKALTISHLYMPPLYLSAPSCFLLEEAIITISNE